jgi:4-amino-4-deoxy-L-arabinose transferase-like glycosyltransferase
MEAALQYPKIIIPSQPRNHKRIFLYVILIIALLPRLYHINQPYVDLAGWRETSMAMMADNFYHRNTNILYPEVSWNGPGESYNGREFQTVTYTASLLYRAFGQHDWVGRLVAVFFGVWGVFALYQLVRRLWDEDHALLSAAVLALLPSAIYFDRSFLPDPAMVSLVTTSLWFLIAYLQTDKNRYLILTMVIGCLGFLTKITGMLVLLPALYAVIVILHKRGTLTIAALAKLAVPALVMLGIVAAYYLWARYLSHTYPPYHFAGESNWVWDEGVNTWVQRGYFLRKTTYLFTHWMLGKPFVALFIAGIFTSVFYIYIKNRHRESSQNDVRFTAPYFFHFWLLGYLFFYSIGAKELSGNFWNFQIGNPMIAAFCSSTVLFVWKVLRQYKVVAVGFSLLLVVSIIRSDRKVLRNTFTDEYYKADYQMGLHLRGLRQPGDLVVVLSHAIGNPLPIFYSQGRGWVFPPVSNELPEHLPPTDAACIAALEELHGKGADWFGVNRKQYDTLETTYPKFLQHLSRYPVRASSADYVIFQLKP